MTAITPSLTNDDVRLLTEFLDDEKRTKETFRFHELLGFLFAVASSPEMVTPSDWLPIIGGDEDLNFANTEEAEQIFGLLMGVYNEINTAVLEGHNALPAWCAFDDDIDANFDDNASIAQWSRGLAAGHDWLLEIWSDYLFGEMDEEFGMAFMVLAFFSSKKLAEEFYAEADPKKHRKKDSSFEGFAGTIRDIFPDALAAYAHIGRTIFEAISEQDSINTEPVKSTKVGRNEPCPCGSGKKHKKCCGNRIH